MQGEWQPIETAPKDGTRVIVYPPNMFGDIVIAKFTKDDWISDDRWGLHDLTHWMPLPKPPA